MILVHGFLATYHEDLDQLDELLKRQGFCTSSAPYGGFAGQILAGGLRSINESSEELPEFTQHIASRTGAWRIDLVGHSEVAFHILYVPKSTVGTRLFDNAFLIAPPAQGTSTSGVYSLAYFSGKGIRKLIGNVLETIGCGAYNDLGPDGPAVVVVDKGPIA